MKKQNKILLIGLALFLAFGAYRSLYVRFLDPIEVVRAHAASEDWPEEDLLMIGGGYTSGVLAFTAQGQFRSKTGERSGVLHVECVKPTPLHGWSLRSYRIE